MGILNLLLLSKDARLFDTKEFLIKAFLAVLLGSFVGRWVPYVSKDMISLLFGMILTIEPVNVTGIRNGFKQIEATVIGAVITGLILFFLGYTPWSAAIALTATLYVSLKINWREFSVVAVFTSIYMTQYVQLDALGNPSEFETFKLRIAALFTGVAIALLMNFTFSLFGYRHMLEKRVYHLLGNLRTKMSGISQMIREEHYEQAGDIMGSFPGLFNNIDWIFGTILDFKKDPIVKRSKVKKVRLEKILKMTTLIREMTHINYDICYKISKGTHAYKEGDFLESYERTAHRIDLLMENLDGIIHNKDTWVSISIGTHDKEDTALHQLGENIEHINQLIGHYL